MKTLATGAIQRVSTGAQDSEANGSSDDAAWSPDGTKIAFVSDASNLVSGDNNSRRDVFVKTLATGAIQRVSTDAAGGQANDESYSPKWSPDSARIAFVSVADNLVAGDTNGVGGFANDGQDVFAKTLVTDAIQRISTDVNGAETNRSANSGSPAWSPTGREVAFDADATNLVPSDTNDASDVFVKTIP